MKQYTHFTKKLEGQVSFSFYPVGYASGIYYVYPTPYVIERGIVFQKHHSSNYVDNAAAESTDISVNEQEISYK